MALDFNGSTDKLLNGSVAALTSVPCTFAGWVNPDVSNAVQRIIGCYRSSTQNPIMCIELLNDGKAYTEFRNDTGGAGNSSAPASTTSYATGTWQHIAGTIDNSGVARIFYNGVLEATGVTPSHATVTLDTTSIGMRSTTTENHFFNGGLAETAGWNRILSNDEISGLADGYSPLWFLRGLKIYTDLIRVAGRPFIGPTLTLTGTSPIAHPPKIIYPRRRFIPVALSATFGDGDGAASGTGTATGIGASIAASTGAAAGVGTATGIAPGTGGFVAASALNPTLN